MAGQPQENTSSTSGNSFVKGMIKDLNDSSIPPGTWTHARNATQVSPMGDLTTLSNEPANLKCLFDAVPYTVIGFAHKIEDIWVIFSTDNTNSEIGIFDDSACSYIPIVTPQYNSVLNIPATDTSCLNFKQEFLITGVVKQNFDCTWSVYFADANNPDRTMNIDNPPLVCVNTPVVVGSNCDTCVPIGTGIPANPYVLDCDKLRLASLMTVPCLDVELGHSGGNLPNGSYFAVIAYMVNGQVVSDYFPPSNTQPIFSHLNNGGSLQININTIDNTYFTDFQLVVVSTVNQQTSAKNIGIYSTRTSAISIDFIDPTLPDIPIELIPVITPEFEMSEAMYPIANYLVRVAPTTNFDFNYQPLANGIVTKWCSVEYPGDYYKNGGNKTSYLRDEVYPFYIRWVYNTGTKSASYHIPGRPSIPSDLVAPNLHDKLFPNETQQWQVANTAYSITPLSNILPDGGVEIAEGLMSYWQSTEIYPDNKPTIWNASSHPWSINIPGQPLIDLCGDPIRHHKMPDQSISPLVNHFRTDFSGNTFIRLLGVKFENIRPPVDNDGNPITNIVGYEILRGTREGNKSIIAKGIVNNTRIYDLTTGNRQGLYQNFPYNPLGPDITLTDTDPSTHGGYAGLNALTPLSAATRYSKNVFTVHSPDTQFRHPFLSTKEIKIYGELTGTVTGSFSEVPDHPKEKLMGDISFFIAAMVGLGAASLSILGQRTETQNPPANNATGIDIIGVSSGTDSITGIAQDGIISGYNLGLDGADATTSTMLNVLATALFGNGSLITPAGSIVDTTTTASDLASTIIGMPLASTVRSREWGQTDYQGPIVRIFNGVMSFVHYWTLGTDAAMRLLEALVNYNQYAYRYLSHGFYDTFIKGNATTGNTRFLLNNANYLENQIQDFGSSYKVNNLYRGSAVVIETASPISNPSGIDNTVTSIGKSGFDPNTSFQTTATSYYGALKVELDAQYGQIGSVREIPISCEFDKSMTTSDVIFGGDTYVSRYTEKNTFFYFYDWLYKQPDGYEWDYRLRYMVNYPNYWADFTRFEASDFLKGVYNFFTSGLNASSLAGGLPSGRARLDYSGAANNPTWGSFVMAFNMFFSLEIKNAYFYLFQSGVRDFFVESEVNTDLRDWGDLDAERFYDPYGYTDLPALFNTGIIKAGNYFKYDYSLSTSRQFSNFISWGTMQNQSTYDPITAENCFKFYPYKLIYSLPQNQEATKDYWRVFLPANYYNFKSTVTAIKTVNKSGAIILFEADSPVMFQGTDQLQTTLGTKLTIGDGGLFTQPQQSIVNTEESLEYGSCQNRLSVINTPMGIFWMSENQGKIFSYTGGINDIGYMGLKYWLKKYLPYVLTQDFPNYPLTDNPVAGIGCQAVYDNQIETVYFCKKDYMLLPQYKGRVVYVPLDPVTGKGDYFVLDAGAVYELGDPFIFQDASWTLSYDPKEKAWLSYHDWHPNLLLPSKNNFLSIIGNSFWRHNLRVDLFCNYYGIDYPFELEYVAASGVTVNTLRSIEYYLECYKYDTNGFNKFHKLEFNFDRAVIYNTEQVSGTLVLNNTPVNNPYGSLNYPIIGTTQIDILYVKKEQKYRFNQFWDITDDRGEFTTAERYIWLWESNGYKRILNPVNLNYNKNAFQRKKFRHYLTNVILSKDICGDTKLLMKVSVDKNLISKR